MTQPTGFYDRHGIPIHVGDLIRVKHYRHRRSGRQMWMYKRVALVDSRLYLQDWQCFDPKAKNGMLRYLKPDDIEVLDEAGIQRNRRGEIQTFNERPKKKRN